MKFHRLAVSIVAALGAAALIGAPYAGLAANAVPSHAGSAAAADAAAPLELAVGEQRMLAQGRALQRVAVGDPSVADVLIVKGDRRGGVLLVGKGAGTTRVMLWERGNDTPLTFTVSVVTAAARALLGNDTGTLAVLGGNAVIAGSAASMEAHQRAVAAAGSAVGSAVGSAANGAAYGGANGGAGSGANGGANGAAGKGKDNKGGGATIDVSTVATRPVVQVDVRVVEFSRAVLKQIGFNFFKQNNGFSFGSFAPSALTSASLGPNGAQIQSTMPISSAFNLVFGSATHDLFANLSVMESNNLARVLAEPTLVALSGQSASFLAGGEIPVPVPQALGTTSIEYKPYGVGLTLTPTVLSPQRIALKVAPEASQLDFVHSVTVNGISVPAITTRRADTTVELGDGESFVIGGLIDRETASNVDKVPLLGDLPVIGVFFKQLNYQQTDKELVIVVTPHLVSPLAKGAALPDTPGARSEQRDGPVWRSLLGGALSTDAAPGFSK
ncbi:type II and III secretion system protein family protein [Paraburkholderia solisilvae]|uniref:Type 3 secretion system secretin n=1 Tax=Paraburkholderia solisilvae TaxID=624376 RepID=A0A6J5F0U6_9BURK|nr:type II and III secretion system protein family protein [Paraburkholderia solisilvae]CAB3771287.1 Type 3 secretion system secretin [Paraburkholderia solisilvae]